MMLHALECWNDEREGRGDARLDIGIGLNFGPVVVGDVGSEQSMSFAVIGDTVNTAARFQALSTLPRDAVGGGGSCRSGDPRIVLEIAADCIGQLEDRGEYHLRGRASPVRVWTRKVKPASGASAA